MMCSKGLRKSFWNLKLASSPFSKNFMDSCLRESTAKMATSSLELQPTCTEMKSFSVKKLDFSSQVQLPMNKLFFWCQTGQCNRQLGALKKQVTLHVKKKCFLEIYFPIWWMTALMISFHTRQNQFAATPNCQKAFLATMCVHKWLKSYCKPKEVGVQVQLSFFLFTLRL